MANTAPYDFWYPANPGDIPPSDEWEHFAETLNNFLAQFTHLFGSGFASPAQVQPSIVSSQLAVQVSAGFALIGDANLKVWVPVAAHTIDNTLLGTGDHEGAIVASATNYFFLKQDGYWHVDQDNSAPTGFSEKAFTGVTDTDDFTSVDGNPTGRSHIGLKGVNLSYGYKSVVFADTPYTVLDTDDVIEVDCTGGAVTLNLPLAKNRYKKLVIMKVDASGNAVTINRAGSDTINGATSTTLTSQWQRKDFFSNGNAGWRF
jgi:hypothetical protein